MRRFVSPWFFALALVIPSLAYADVSDSDKDFLSKAAQGNVAEVKLAELALTHADSPAVKSFAEKMMKDHTAASVKLTAIAAKKSVTLPAEPSSEQKKTYDELAKLNGPDFDKAYMAAMVLDHDTDVRLFEEATKTAEDKDIKAFATKTLPTLKSHQKMAHHSDAKKHM